MRTRTVQIIIEENADGRKRRVGKVYEATALMLLEPQVAGEGLLTILGELIQQLDGPPKAEPMDRFPQPEATVESEQPAPAPAPRPPNTDENPTFRKPKLAPSKASGKSPT